MSSESATTILRMAAVRAWVVEQLGKDAAEHIDPGIVLCALEALQTRAADAKLIVRVVGEMTPEPGMMRVGLLSWSFPKYPGECEVFLCEKSCWKAERVEPGRLEW